MDKLSYTVDWPVKYGMPVAYGSFTLGDIVTAVDKRGYVKVDNNGLLYLLYRDNVFSQTAKDLLTIPDQPYPQTFGPTDNSFPVSTGMDSVMVSRDTTFVFSFNKSDVEIDSIIFKSGNLSLNGDPFSSSYSLNATFPTFKKNGIALKIGNQAPTPSSVAIDSYKLKFVKKNGVANLIPVHYDLIIRNKKSALTSGISSTINFSSAAFSSIFGYLGRIPDLLNKMSQKMTIDFFEDPNNYGISFKNPSITVYIRNSFGVPIQIQLSNGRTYSDKTKSETQFTISPSVKDINYPKLSEIGRVSNDSMVLDNTVHPGIFDAMQTSPHYLYYSETAMSNPQGNIGISNFFTDSSKLNVDLQLKLPFEMYAGNLGTNDTLGLDLTDIVKDTAMVKKVAIYNTFKNSIPFNLKLQVYLVDSQYHYIDSLYNRTIDNKFIAQPIVKSGNPDPANPGKYIFSAPNTFGVVFDGTRARRLKKVKYAIMKISMSTAGGGATFVKFLSSYKLNVAFQVQTELKVNSLNQF
jgi:hypothetical protein